MRRDGHMVLVVVVVVVATLNNNKVNWRDNIERLVKGAISYLNIGRFAFLPRVAL